MKTSLTTLLFSLMALCFGCQEKASLSLPIPETDTYGSSNIDISDAEFNDKVLGALVGSAIGDAMGAPTEMWHRKDIQRDYGYINGLRPVVRDKSPEGTWGHNMPAGSTTDDTRWKLFMARYLATYPAQQSADEFTEFIIEHYQSQIDDLSRSDVRYNTDRLDEENQRIDWIKGWARVALARREGPDAYEKAMGRFYGGEMSCAGLLYSPMFGLLHAQPELAYTSAFDHALFDLGYAKDISSLAAAMTAEALQTDDMDTILNVILYVDPYGYKDSRLVGRLAAQMALEGKRLVAMADELKIDDMPPVSVPEAYPGSRGDWMRLQFIYDELEKRQQHIPFHAGEIWQIMYTGLAYGDGDFQKTMAFIVNYGRDNDTVAAVAGFILGARAGFSRLPEAEKTRILEVNKDVLGIDLNEVAKDIEKAAGRHVGG